MHYPDRRILGVVVPTIEEAIEQGYKKLAVIGTNYTIGTGIYTDELKKIDPAISITERAAPLLVPLIENGGEAYLDTVLDGYLTFMEGEGFEALLLGCTHYIHLKERIRERYDFDVIAQDEMIPHKLDNYFNKHPEIIDKINKNSFFNFFATDLTEPYQESASALFGKTIDIQHMEGVHG